MGKWIKSYEVMKPRFVRVIDIVRLFLGVAIAFLPRIAFFATEVNFGRGIFVGFFLSLLISLDGFLDYFVYAGISSGKKNGMGMLMSSYHGKEFISDSLKGEAMVRFFRLLLTTVVMALPGNICNLWNDIDGMLFVVLVMLLFYAVTNFILMLSRKVAITITIHWLIIYSSLAVEILFLVVFYELFDSFKADGNAISMAAGSIVLVLLTALDLISAMALVRVNNKGFAKGYFS